MARTLPGSSSAAGFAARARDVNTSAPAASSSPLSWTICSQGARSGWRVVARIRRSGPARQQSGRQPRHRLDDVFDDIEDKQASAPGQVVADEIDLMPGGLGQLECPSHARGDTAGQDRGEVHKPHRPGECGWRGRDLDREPGFSDPARSGQRHKSGRRQRCPEGGKVAVAPDQRGHRHRWSRRESGPARSTGRSPAPVRRLPPHATRVPVPALPRQRDNGEPSRTPRARQLAGQRRREP